MLLITKKHKESYSEAYCDKCGQGYEWDGVVSFTAMERILRNRHWTMGISHICMECKNRKNKNA